MLSESYECANEAHNICKRIDCDCKCHHFRLTKEEVEYLVNNIQHEYLSKDTYHFAIDLFNRMEKFLTEQNELAGKTSSGA